MLAIELLDPVASSFLGWNLRLECCIVQINHATIIHDTCLAKRKGRIGLAVLCEHVRLQQLSREHDVTVDHEPAGFRSLNRPQALVMCDRSCSDHATPVERTNESQKHVARVDRGDAVLSIRARRVDGNSSQVRIPDIIAKAGQNTANLSQLIFEVVDG